MDTLSAILACCLLVTSVAVAQTEKGNLTVTTTNPPISNATQTPTILMTTTNSTAKATVTSNVYKDATTSLSSATRGNETLVQTTTTHPPTSQSTTTTMTQAVTNSTTLTTSTPAASTFTVLTASGNQTTAGYISTPDTTAITTANSSQTENKTSQSEDNTTPGLRLDITEQNMTIVFSVILGVFLVSLVILTLYKCKQKMQYVHQPLNNSDEPSAFVADDDTLVISGGLYDAYPTNDTIPTIPDDQSQFRLEFLH